MKNEKENAVVEQPKNEVATTGGLAFQQKILGELERANHEFGADFTPYGKTCAINCIAGLVMFCKQNKIELKDINPALLRLQIQNVGFTELNYASIPSEVYFDIRKTKNADGKLDYILTIKPQGAGNEKLVRKYGVGIKKGTGLHNAILIREGDPFEMPQFDGLKVTPFKYMPKLENANNKVIAVVYPVEKTDGSVEYLIATRDSVKANLIAQIRQNALYGFTTEEEYTAKNGKTYTKEIVNKEARDKFYAHVDELAEKLTVDELLANAELADFINPTYTSGGSKEAMILRKMKNNALKNYPKEYDNSFVAESVHNMFEENDPTVLERKKPSEVVATVNAELDEDLNDDIVDDFNVNDVDLSKGKELKAEDFQPVEEQKDDGVPF